MLLQVHDKLLFEAPEAEADDTARGGQGGHGRRLRATLRALGTARRRDRPRQELGLGTIIGSRRIAATSPRARISPISTTPAISSRCATKRATSCSRNGRRPHPADVRLAAYPEAPQVRVSNDPDCSGIVQAVFPPALSYLPAASGFVDLSPENREKSRSVVQSWAPCSNEIAARTASMTSAPAVWPTRTRPCSMSPRRSPRMPAAGWASQEGIAAPASEVESGRSKTRGFVAILRQSRGTVGRQDALLP
jgi:hypothetical protein